MKNPDSKRPLPPDLMLGESGIIEELQALADGRKNIEQVSEGVVKQIAILLVAIQERKGQRRFQNGDRAEVQKRITESAPAAGQMIAGATYDPETNQVIEIGHWPDLLSQIGKPLRVEKPIKIQRAHMNLTIPEGSVLVISQASEKKHLLNLQVNGGTIIEISDDLVNWPIFVRPV